MFTPFESTEKKKKLKITAQFEISLRDPRFAFVVNSMFIENIATVKKKNLWHSFGLQFPVMLCKIDKTASKTKKATVLSTILTITVVLFEKIWFYQTS